MSDRTSTWLRSTHDLPRGNSVIRSTISESGAGGDSGVTLRLIRSRLRACSETAIPTDLNA